MVSERRSTRTNKASCTARSHTSLMIISCGTSCLRGLVCEPGGSAPRQWYRQRKRGRPKFQWAACTVPYAFRSCLFCRTCSSTNYELPSSAPFGRPASLLVFVTRTTTRHHHIVIIRSGSGHMPHARAWFPVFGVPLDRAAASTPTGGARLRVQSLTRAPRLVAMSGVGFSTLADAAKRIHASCVV